MNILIKGSLGGTNILPTRVSKLLKGCKVSLVTMNNPEGKDKASRSYVKALVIYAKKYNIDYVPSHEVDVYEIIASIKRKYGGKTTDLMRRALVKKFSSAILMATIEIPAEHCEVVP